jgi:O-antigen/teichoic acid export membrane protein
MILLAPTLVTAWVGSGFSASVIVLRLLTISVIVRVGNATASTLLKGAGEHRLVAFMNVGVALVNLALSIALVTRLGLSGVAIGTLVPVCVASTLILFPAACRRVELPVWHALMEAVWPAVWPAAVMTLYVLATRALVPPHLFPVAIEMVSAWAIYAAVFGFFGISETQRQAYQLKVVELLRRRTTAAHQLTGGA